MSRLSFAHRLLIVFFVEVSVIHGCSNTNQFLFLDALRPMPRAMFSHFTPRNKEMI